MAVQFSQVMTGTGSPDDGGHTLLYQNTNGTKNSTNMTTVAGDTLLVVTIAGYGTGGGYMDGSDPATVTVTWDGVPITRNLTAFSDQTYGGSHCTAAIFTMVNPAIGNKTLGVTWPVASDVYVSAISFKGTDTTTGINVADNNINFYSNATPNTALSVDIAGSSDGATLSTFVGGSNTPTFNKTGFWGASPYNPGGGGQYEIGGTGTRTHTFTVSSTNILIATGIHILAGTGGSVSVAWLRA